MTTNTANSTTSPSTATPPAQRTLRVRVARFEKPGSRTIWEDFDVPIETGSNVISVLQWICANPVTIGGKNTTPVAFDAACLEEVCGSCTMLINGRTRQACSALIDDLIAESGMTLTLAPMSKFPIVRDLMVDRDRMFHDLQALCAWVPIDGTYDLGSGPQSTPELQQERYTLSTCMTCGCCVEACPQFSREDSPTDWDHSFTGAFSISQARLFNDHETGSVLKNVRLDYLMGPAGISNCGNAQNCVEVCPKEIPLAESIAAVGRAVTIRSIKRMFGG